MLDNLLIVNYNQGFARCAGSKLLRMTKLRILSNHPHEAFAYLDCEVSRMVSSYLVQVIHCFRATYVLFSFWRIEITRLSPTLPLGRILSSCYRFLKKENDVHLLNATLRVILFFCMHRRYICYIMIFIYF